MAISLPIFQWPGAGGGSATPTAPASPATPTTPAIPNPTQGNQTQPQQQSQTPTQQSNQPNFTASDNTGVEIQAVNPPLTPDQIVGVYDTPLERPALPTLKLDNIKAPQVKNKSIQGHLRAIESKLTSTEKLMKDVIKLQRLHLITEKEFFQRKTELYQNTFEEYLLDKTVDFGKKKKGCTCINLPENVPKAGGLPVTAPSPAPNPAPNPARQPQQQTQPQTSPATAPAPVPSPIFDPGGWQQTPQQTPKPNIPQQPTQAPSPKQGPPGGSWQLPPFSFPPIPRLLPDLGGGLAILKEKLTPIAQKLKEPLTPEQKQSLYDNAIAIGQSIGFGAEQVMSVLTSIAAVGAAVVGMDQLIPNNASGGIIPFASGGIPGSDLELYNSQSSNFFNKVSNSATQIASDIPLGPHTPLPHPGYVKPQGGHIPRPNLRGMPGPSGNPMPWGWQPTLLAKGAITNAADGKMFGPSWMPWNWGKVVDKHRNSKPQDYANQQGLGANLAKRREMYKELGMYSSGGVLGQINKFNPFAHILKFKNALMPPTPIKPKMPSLPPSAKQIMQYPEGISTGVGGGNAGSSRNNRRVQTASARPISRPVSRTPQTIEKPIDPYANDLTKYNQLISEGKTDEAEQLGMKIWQSKHKDTNMMKPKTDNPLTTSSLKLESAQNSLMNNNTSTEKLNNISQIIPLPPIQKNIPKSRSSKASDDSTLAPPPSPSSKPSIFSRSQSFYR